MLRQMPYFATRTWSGMLGSDQPSTVERRGRRPWGQWRSPGSEARWVGPVFQPVPGAQSRVQCPVNFLAVVARTVQRYPRKKPDQLTEKRID